MATIQIYEDDDNNARLFDRDLIITFAQKDYGFITSFSKNGITRILNRMGYLRKSEWISTDWGWESKFIRKSNRKKE